MRKASTLQEHARSVAIAMVIAGCSSNENPPATQQPPGADAGVPPDAATGDGGGVSPIFTQSLVEDLITPHVLKFTKAK